MPMKAATPSLKIEQCKVLPVPCGGQRGKPAEKRESAREMSQTAAEAVALYAAHHKMQKNC
jgi:hypothetical protein